MKATMKRKPSRRERKERAARLLDLSIPAMGLTMAEGARAIGVTYRTLCAWREFGNPDHPLPAGKNLLRAEAFLRKALRALKKKGVVKESLEELSEVKP